MEDVGAGVGGGGVGDEMGPGEGEAHAVVVEECEEGGVGVVVCVSLIAGNELGLGGGGDRWGLVGGLYLI